VNNALDCSDLATLRKVAAVRGLVSDAVRARVWPLLLGVEQLTARSPRELEALSATPHRDSAVVHCDVARSLWSVDDDGLRARKRLALARLLNSAVALHPGVVHYYQGLHDVASVLLLAVGEAAALPLLSQLCKHHLRDCTSDTLQPVMRVLELLLPILSLVDPQLHAFLRRSGVLPYFALTWVLTWHVHESPNIGTSTRLFDLFLSSTPLMPLYVGLAALQQQRADVLALPCEAPEVHQFLSRLNVLGSMSVDRLAARALALYREHPPSALARIGVRLPPGSAAAEWPFPFVMGLVEKRGSKKGRQRALRRALAVAIVGGSFIMRAVLAG
jgi:hypothetical protein